MSPYKEIKSRQRIGVYVCHCGVNIGATVGISKVVEFAAALPKVVVARDYSYVCSDPGQKLILEDIEKLGINRVVMATCSPRLHEPTFRKTLEDYTGVRITDQALSEAIRSYNQNRRKARAIYELRKTNPPLISGLELTKLLTVGSSLPVAEANQLFDQILDQFGQSEQTSYVAGLRR